MALRNAVAKGKLGTGYIEPLLSRETRSTVRRFEILKEKPFHDVLETVHTGQNIPSKLSKRLVLYGGKGGIMSEGPFRRATRMFMRKHKPKKRKPQSGDYIDKNGYKRDAEHNLIHRSFFPNLKPGMIVHHINGRKLDNRPKNLMPMSALTHCYLHEEMHVFGRYYQRKNTQKAVARINKNGPLFKGPFAGKWPHNKADLEKIDPVLVEYKRKKRRKTGNSAKVFEPKMIIRRNNLEDMADAILAKEVK